ncbi:MAG: prepilin peptidase [Candidatus Aenigmatarchaeota archaeon]
MFELLLIAITLIGSFAAGIYDLKTSNIPDTLCILMIIFGLAIHSFNSFLTGDFSILTSSLLFGGLFLAFGLLMYYTGQWGGGDGELLVTIGVLLPKLSIVKTYFPFAISFFINSFFIGAFYSIIYALILSYKIPFIPKKFFNSINKPLVIFSLISLSILSLISFFYLKILSIFFFLIFVLIIFLNFSKTIENGFYKKIPVSKLKVDDMLGEDIPKLKIYKRFIRGLTKEEVKKIKKIKKYVIIREGIRYGLVFPLTLIFTLLFGDIFFLFF